MIFHYISALSENPSLSSSTSSLNTCSSISEDSFSSVDNMTETDTTELSLELKRRKLKIKELKEKKTQRDYEKLMEVSLGSNCSLTFVENQEFTIA